jgi:hypothetical protein
MGGAVAIRCTKTWSHHLSSGQIAQSSSPLTLQPLIRGASPRPTPRSFLPQTIDVPMSTLFGRQPSPVPRQPSPQTAGTTGTAHVEIPTRRKFERAKPAHRNTTLCIEPQCQHVGAYYTRSYPKGKTVWSHWTGSVDEILPRKGGICQDVVERDPLCTCSFAART